MTANIASDSGHLRMAAERGGSKSIYSRLRRMVMDGGHAVFKTVCGALLRRPGWVRFPSIPATFGWIFMKDEVRGKAEEIRGKVTGDRGEEMKGRMGIKI